MPRRVGGPPNPRRRRRSLAASGPRYLYGGDEGPEFMSPSFARRVGCRTKDSSMNSDLTTHDAFAPEAETAPAASLKLTPRSSAERMCRTRQRRRQGLRCVSVELGETQIETLIRYGWLSRSDRASPAAIRKALHSYLDDHLGDAQRRLGWRVTQRASET